MSIPIEVVLPEVPATGHAEALALRGRVHLAIGFGDNAILFFLAIDDARRLGHLLIDTAHEAEEQLLTKESEHG